MPDLPPLEPWVKVAPTAPMIAPVAPEHIEFVDRGVAIVVEGMAKERQLTPKLNGLQDAFTAFAKRVETAAESLTARMDSVATQTEAAVTKFGGAVDKVEAQAKAIDDAANQLTNGGPPLGNS